MYYCNEFLRRYIIIVETKEKQEDLLFPGTEYLAEPEHRAFYSGVFTHGGRHAR